MNQQTLFHDTIGLSQEETVKAESQAEKQGRLVLDFLKQYAGVWFTPYNVYSSLIKSRQISNKTPLTSIGRAMTNLTSDGYLIKSEKADKPGPYHLPNHSWTLNVGKA